MTGYSDILVVVPAAVIFAELLFRCPLIKHAHATARTAHKSLRVVCSSRISEHWKEVVLTRYARMLLVSGAHVSAWILAGLAVFLAVVALTDYAVSGRVTSASVVPSTMQTVAATVVGGLYGFVRTSYGWKQLLPR